MLSFSWLTGFIAAFFFSAVDVNVSWKSERTSIVQEISSPDFHSRILTEKPEVPSLQIDWNLSWKLNSVWIPSFIRPFIFIWCRHFSEIESPSRCEGGPFGKRENVAGGGVCIGFQRAHGPDIHQFGDQSAGYPGDAHCHGRMGGAACRGDLSVFRTCHRGFGGFYRRQQHGQQPYIRSVPVRVAERLILPTTIMVALQAVGAAAGNIIAIHNVVAASATVGYLSKERLIIRKTIIPTLYYIILVGLMGMVAMHWMGVSEQV